jgi:hypothetical protein
MMRHLGARYCDNGAAYLGVGTGCVSLEETALASDECGAEEGKEEGFVEHHCFFDERRDYQRGGRCLDSR